MQTKQFGLDWVPERTPPRPTARLLLSLIAAAACAALAMFGVWTYGELFPKIAITRGGGTSSPPARWYYLRDEEIALAFVSASLLWLLLLWRIWRPLISSRHPLAPVLLTAALGLLPALGMLLHDCWPAARRIADDELAGGVLVVLALLGAIIVWIRWASVRAVRPGVATLGRGIASIVIAAAAIGAALIVDQVINADEELLMGALLSGGSGLIAWIWLKPLVKAEGRDLPESEGQLNLRCPHCNYSLIGLRELRCPECGQTFVLDELIRAQRWILPSAATSESSA